MGNWDSYQREERPRLTPGDYRVEIVSVEESISKAGNPMIVIKVRPNGSKIDIPEYFVKGEYFNPKMTQFFDSFNIDDGDFTFPTWIGAVGAARLKEDDQGYLKVHYFINKDRAEKLPPWDGPMPERQEITKIQEAEDDGDIPF